MKINFDELVQATVAVETPTIIKQFVYELAAKSPKFSYMAQCSLRERMIDRLDLPLVKFITEASRLQSDFLVSWYETLHQRRIAVAVQILDTKYDFLENPTNFSNFIEDWFDKESQEWFAEWAEKNRQ